MISGQVWHRAHNGGTGDHPHSPMMTGDMILTRRPCAWLGGVVSAGSVQYQLSPPHRREMGGEQAQRITAWHHRGPVTAATQGPGFLGNNNWIWCILLIWIYCIGNRSGILKMAIWKFIINVIKITDWVLNTSIRYEEEKHFFPQPKSFCYLFELNLMDIKCK